MTAAPACVCGHAKVAHEHYRDGTDCVLCDCKRYRKPWGRGARWTAMMRLKSFKPGNNGTKMPPMARS